MRCDDGGDRPFALEVYAPLYIDPREVARRGGVCGGD